MNNSEFLQSLAERGDGSLQAWFDAEHMDAQSKAHSKTWSNLTEQSESLSDANATCNNSGDFVTDDSREKLEADVLNHVGLVTNRDTVFEWLDRQAEITRKTEQAAWIQQANGLIHEANVERDELRDAINVLQEKQPYCYDPDKPLDTIKTIGRYIDELQAKVDELEGGGE